MHITDLEPSQVDEAAELAAAAYAEDPIFQAVFSTAKRRRAFHLTEQGITLRQHDPARVVRVAIDGGAVVGVAIWKTDGAGGGVPGELDRRAEKLLRTFFRKLGADRQPYARFAVALRAAMPMDPDVFLAQLAVRPDRQREGIGQALLDDGLARADARERTVRLQTSLPRNVAFYERSGFVVVGRHELYIGSPPLWNMRRDHVR
ncbi:GNAT family N-acetyltransferase [Promicromonospora thailandica]|uniref:Acetyltransferase (GNAT) family protein n=1 Tax=Promicromonospora thailandica TaxID=765201 RepID=A0A9X2G801_9MICO|nr:GNAT family N-acetyltransferase [Promicromonospora thailandica]MCP2264266.1 Acetyltransferase (GNAT) family protein [Promicromonospora thailandica]